MISDIILIPYKLLTPLQSPLGNIHISTYPLKIKAPPVEPVKSENSASFKEFVTPLKAELDSIPLGSNKDYSHLLK